MAADNSNRKADDDEKYSLGILKLAINKNKQIEEFTINHLKNICNDDNVCNILNEAANLKCKLLVDHCLHHMKTQSYKAVTTDGFKKLSADVLTYVLRDAAPIVSNLIIFRAFVGWMKVNSAESSRFPEALKCIDLRNLEISEIINAIHPTKLIDGNVLLNILRDHLNANVFTPHRGFHVNNDGQLTSATKLAKGITLNHAVGRGNKNVFIDLTRLDMLNYLEMELAKGDWSYWVEISTDNVNWTRIVDYSKYVCRSVQRLFFKLRPVRYIRICGIAPVDGTFEILRLAAYRSTEPFEVDTQTGIVIPTSNVALTEKHAVVIQGENHNGGMLNGTWLGYTEHKISKYPITVQLPQPYLLDSMNVLVLGKDSYNYVIEISIDKVNWTQVLNEEEGKSWLFAKFDKQPVVFVKITATYKPVTVHLRDTFYCRQLECPTITEIKTEKV